MSENINEIGVDAFFDTAFYNNKSNWENNVLYIGKALIDAEYYYYDVDADEDVKWEVSGKYSIKSDTKCIAQEAFKDCYNLTSIIINEGVKYIKAYTFENCSSLNNVVLPNSLESIEGYSFSNCKSLNAISLPQNISNIETNAFFGCNSLQNIFVDLNNPKYSSENGILFNKDKSILLQYPANNQTSAYSIPNSVTTIGSNAFLNCTNLVKINIPETVVQIEINAFNNCSSLASITIPDKVSRIEYGTFLDCVSLSEINLPNNLEYIGRAFDNTAYFNNLSNWDENVLYIGNYLISGRYYNEKNEDVELTVGKSYQIKEGTTIIATAAFNNCETLDSISIPNSVISIGEDAFYNTGYYNNTNNWEDYVLYIDDCLIIGGYEDEESWYDIPTNYTIKSGTRVIACGAFKDCSSLETLNIPEDVVYIGDEAINCKSLTSVTISKSIKYIGKNAIGYNTSPINKILVKNFVINGYTGTVARKYSIENKIIFNSLGKVDCEHIHEKISMQNASCSEEGYINFECNKCGNSYNTSIPATGKHSYISKITKQASCAEEGVITYTCKCGKSYTKPISKKSHSYRWIITKKATYFASGKKVYKCSACGKVAKTATIAKLKLKTPSASVKSGKKYIKVTYKKVSGATGFQVLYKKGSKSVVKTFKTTKSATKTISKLKKGTYKVYVRAFVQYKSKKAYSSWTRAKKVKVK